VHWDFNSLLTLVVFAVIACGAVDMVAGGLVDDSVLAASGVLNARDAGGVFTNANGAIALPFGGMVFARKQETMRAGQRGDTDKSAPPGNTQQPGFDGRHGNILRRELWRQVCATRGRASMRNCRPRGNECREPVLSGTSGRWTWYLSQARHFVLHG